MSEPIAASPSPHRERFRFHRQAILIFVAALAIRLVHLWQLRASPFISVLLGDSRGYHEWALRLAAGDWIGRDVFYQAPLYPYFLGAIYAIGGPDLVIVRVVQALLGAAACVLVGYAAARFFSPRAGLIAGLMLAVYAPAIFLGALIQKSILDVFFVSLMLWLLSELSTGRRRLRWMAFGLGVTLGALSLTRENALALVAVVLVWLLVSERRSTFARSGDHTRFAATAAFVVGLTLVLLPVATRNALVGGGFYLTTSQFGSNFYIGNNPRADGTYMSLREGRGDPAYEQADAAALAERALGRSLSPADVSAFWRDRAMQFITTEPARWLSLVGRKVLLVLNATEMIDTEAQESHEESSTVLAIASRVGHFGVLLPFAVLGAWLAWKDRQRLWVLYALTAAYALTVVLFFVVARYRYPLIPFVILFAAAGLDRLPAFLRASRRQQVAALAAAGVVAILAQRPTLSGDVMRAITETNLGVALHAQGRLDEAILHYRKAADISPGYAVAYNNLGVTLRAQGKLDEAIVAYQQAVKHRPDYPDAHYNLATALLENNRPREALSHFDLARESMPRTARAHNNVGIALASAGRHDEAITQFRAALALEPKSTITLRNLGDALAKRGQYAEAIRLLSQRLTLDDKNPAAHYDLGNVFMASGRVPEATVRYRATIALAPDSADAHSTLGVALAAQGQMREAIAHFEQALELKPDFVEAQRYLAIARQSLKP